MKTIKPKIPIILFFIISIIFILVFFINNNKEKTSEPDNSTEEVVFSKSYNGEVIKEEFEIVTEENIPNKVSQIIEVNKEKKGYIKVSDTDANYLVVFSGEKGTGGYGYKVDAIKIKNIGDKTEVTVVETEPPEDAIVSQAITYPYIIIKLDKDIPTNFDIRNDKNEKFNSLAQ